MDREEFLEKGKRIAKKPVREVTGRLGNAGRLMDRDDLEQEASEELLILHRDRRVDFAQKGWKSFVRIKVRGRLMNIAKNGWRDAGSQIPESEFGVEPDGSPLDMDEIVFCHGMEPREDEETNRVKNSLLATVREFLETLSRDDRFILMSKYSDGKSNEDIGRIQGYSREKVRRKVSKVLEDLIAFLERNGWMQMDIKETLK